jgi:hypothetical protein
MQNAIKINDNVSIIVIFTTVPVDRLTPNGFESTTAVVCNIEKADGLILLGSGMSLLAGEDEPDDVVGYKHALERALKAAFPYDKDARRYVHELFQWAVLKVEDEAEQAIIDREVYDRFASFFDNNFLTVDVLTQGIS